MEKVVITADTVLNIIQSVFNDEDIDKVVVGDNLPEEWQGKSIQDLLNIKYYTFKHRPESSEMIIAEKRRDGVDVSELEALNRSFGCLVLNNVDRIFATNTDVATCDATLDFWVQTSKIKLLERLIDKSNIALSGRVLPLDFMIKTDRVDENNQPIYETEHRTVALVFGRLASPEFEPESPIGESVQCSVDVQLTIQPETILMKDVKVEFATEAPGGEDWDSVMTEVVAEQFSLSSVAQTKGLPLSLDNSKTGTVNTSVGRTFSITIPALKNNFTAWLTAYALNMVDINSPVYMRVAIDVGQENKLTTIYTTVITDLHLTAKNDGTDVAYSLTLSERGL